MKITVELDDSTVRAAVSSQVDAAIARYIDELMEKRIREIVDIKVERITAATVHEEMCKAIIGMVQRNICADPNPSAFAVRQRLQGMVAEAAVQMLKGAARG